MFKSIQIGTVSVLFVMLLVIVQAGNLSCTPAPTTQKPAIEVRDVVGEYRSVERDTATPPAKVPEAGYLIYARADAFDEILPTTKPTKADVKKEIRIFAAPGEYESLSFAIYAKKKLKFVEMEIGDLVSKEGYIIPKDNLDLRAVTCLLQMPSVPARYKVRTSKNLVWVPELLEKKTIFHIFPETSHQFWLTVNVPRSAKAGIYRSVLKAQPINAAEQKIDIVVEVLPFSLEKSDRQFGLYHHRIDRQELFENRRIKTLENYEKDLTLMKEHGVDIIVSSRLSLVGIERQGDRFKIDYSRVIDFFDLCDKVGMKKIVLIPGPIDLTPIKNSGRVTHLKKKLQYDLLVQVTKEVHALHKKKGYAFDLLWTGKDEVHWHASRRKKPELMAENIEFITILRRAVPSIKIYQTYYNSLHHVSSFEESRKLNELVDVRSYGADMERGKGTQEFYGHINRVKDELSAKGVEMWCYYNTHSHKRFHVEEERLANGFWLWRSPFKVNIPCQGQIYFGNPYVDNDEHCFGDSMTIFYPSIIDGSPIPTVTLAAYREGIDDLRYINTLEATIARCKKENIKPAEVAAAEDLLKQLGEKLDSLRTLPKMAQAFELKNYNEMRYKIAKAISNSQVK
jgi:hypothetical protein